MLAAQLAHGRLQVGGRESRDVAPPSSFPGRAEATGAEVHVDGNECGAPEGRRDAPSGEARFSSRVPGPAESLGGELCGRVALAAAIPAKPRDGAQQESVSAGIN